MDVGERLEVAAKVGELDPGTDAAIRAHTATVHRAVAANGSSRTDFILGADGDLTTLEINTNVGLGPRHDLAQTFTATGLTYGLFGPCLVSASPG